MSQPYKCNICGWITGFGDMFGFGPFYWYPYDEPGLDTLQQHYFMINVPVNEISRVYTQLGWDVCEYCLEAALRKRLNTYWWIWRRPVSERWSLWSQLKSEFFDFRALKSWLVRLVLEVKLGPGG